MSGWRYVVRYGDVRSGAQILDGMVILKSMRICQFRVTSFGKTVHPPFS